ncbi:hypothetical protein [Cloacibacterium normanense]|uniref:hypothetical protein n=1 Tax=Cloacibacterium normanense TaxID=237258 RepID=UPI00391C83A4
MGKEELIIIRIQKSQKESWKKLSKEKNITMTNLIKASVESRIFDNERRQIILFIEKQDNVFIKIETNINQIAKTANAQKFISEKEFKKFREILSEITHLKKQQNQIFEKIYEMLAI